LQIFTYRDRAFELSKIDHNQATCLDIHKAYSEVHEHLGNYKDALEHNKRYHLIKEEVHGERSQARLQAMMIKNDTERVYNENKRIAAEKELASLH